MSRRGGNDIGGGLLLMLFIIAFPIMLLIWLCNKISQNTKRISYSTTNKSNNNIAQKSPQKKNSNHFKWIDGKTDELEVDEVNDIEELLEDDDSFDN